MIAALIGDQLAGLFHIPVAQPQPFTSLPQFVSRILHSLGLPVRDAAENNLTHNDTACSDFRTDCHSHSPRIHEFSERVRALANSPNACGNTADYREMTEYKALLIVQADHSPSTLVLRAAASLHSGEI